MKRTLTGDSSISLRSSRPRVSLGVARPSLRARTVARVQARITQGRATTRRPLRGGTSMSGAPLFVGIDVSKSELVVASRPEGNASIVGNDEGGIQDLLQQLRIRSPALVIVEETGSSERGVVRGLVGTGIRSIL